MATEVHPGEKLEFPLTVTNADASARDLTGETLKLEIFERDAVLKASVSTGSGIVYRDQGAEPGVVDVTISSTLTNGLFPLKPHSMVVTHTDVGGDDTVIATDELTVKWPGTQ